MRAFFTGAFLAVTFAFAVFSLPADAQDQDNSRKMDRPPQAQQPPRRFAILAQNLNLTHEQKRQWLQINREINQKVWAVRKDDSLNEAQMQAQLRRIHKEQKQQILSILTPDQQSELKAFWQEQRQKDQNKESGTGSPEDGADSGTGPSAQKGDNAEDDLFAGMVSDDPAPPEPSPTKKARPR